MYAVKLAAACSVVDEKRVSQPMLRARDQATVTNIQQYPPTLVRCLSQSSQSDAAIERLDSLFSQNDKEGVASVAVFWDIERVRHGMVLRLQTDLDDLHWSDDCNGFCDACTEAGCVVCASRMGAADAETRVWRRVT